MFTGIIEHLGTISRLDLTFAGGTVTVQAPTLTRDLSVSASVAVNGCCLTVVHREGNHFFAELSRETLAKTSLGSLKVGARVNLEQAITAGKEFGGHFVLGHVDTTGRVVHLKSEGQSWIYGVEVPEELARYVVSKGSITIDGISLTVARWQNRIAEIAVIPYTYLHTNIRDRRPGDAVNLEGDVLGKYVESYLEARSFSASGQSQLTVARLVEEGF